MYILKGIGASNKNKKVDLSQDFIKRLETAKVNTELWKDTCKMWFNKMPRQLKQGDILISYVVKGEKRNGGKFAGRIMGYSEVVSDTYDGDLENGQWKHYVIIKNVYKNFADKSKHENNKILNISQFNFNFSGTPIQSVYAILDDNMAQRIKTEIIKNN